MESKTESRRSSKTSSLCRMFGKSSNTLDVKAAGSQDKGSTRSFATELFNYFNPYEKIPSNGAGFKLRASISTPDISDSSENPFVFNNVENTKKDNEKTSNSVLMIFIIGGVTPSEIRHVQECHDKHYPNYSVMIGSTHMVTP